jgi:hypothetical protein
MMSKYAGEIMGLLSYLIDVECQGVYLMKVSSRVALVLQMSFQASEKVDITAIEIHFVKGLLF